MHYKRKNLIMKSRDFFRRYLFTAQWRHRLGRLRYVNKHYMSICCGLRWLTDNLEVLAIVLTRADLTGGHLCSGRLGPRSVTSWGPWS